MDNYALPIGERIDWLFDHARRHCEEYASPESWLARRRYLAEHPTAISVLKCMDGRINIPVATNTPVGIIQPFRNLGGRFDLGWPHLGEVLSQHIVGVISEGRRALTLITYHYSKGDPRRGCAGFDYDTAAAIRHTFEIKTQFEFAFGSAHGTVYPLVCGFETDEDALVLHGHNGEVLDLSTITPADSHALPLLLERLYPDMGEQLRTDLLPLVRGNLAHIAEVRRMKRASDIEHREWMICIGRGFDWLHLPNRALIIGPYSPNLADPIGKAALIIETNMARGRIPDDGFLLLATVPYHEIGMERARAVLKSRFMCRFAAGVIRDEFPALARCMHVRTAVLDWRTRALEPLAD
ncbi:MAG TPA: carboxysome shell carbonic anhydrase [Rhodocyclaceae bacterium]|nr:carboxysome shell carbonic anhydrase [Rhodocyclaceae bacterium]